MKTTMLLAVLAVAAAAQDRIEDTLRKGILEEESKQNLSAAIQQYQSVMTQFDNQRKIAATALFRMAESYRKLGRNGEAIAAYRRVVREFGDQTKLAEQSRSHLPATDKAEAGQSGSGAERIEQFRALIIQELTLLEVHLQEMQKKVELGAVDPNSEAMLNVKMDILKKRRELAALDVEGGRR